MEKPKPNFIKLLWDDLSRTIYVGDRLKANRTALAFASIATMVLGIVLIIYNASIHQTGLLISSIMTFIAGTGCAFFTCIVKKRNIAILFPTVFCAITFTVYLFTGVGNGSALFWSLMLPIGMCYFVSVKYGIILSIYYSVLYAVVFFTPIREHFTAYYTPEFMTRFPLVFIFLSVFTAMAMTQYHRMTLMEIDYTDRLNKEVARQTAVAEERAHKIEQMSYQSMQTLANAIDAKDPYTKGHSTRVSLYSALIAQNAGWDEDRVDDLRYAAMLHDIGKIGVPDSILNNPKRLTDVEYGIIKSHTTMGSEILKGKIMIDEAEDVAKHHHERYDGSGYPDGLKGDEISEEARMVAIADAFDAMSSNRVYRKACDDEHIRSELIKGRGRQFDPEYTDIFIKLWDSGALDGILENQTESRTDMETTSTALQEVIEAFTTQNGSEELDAATGVMNRTAGESTIAKAIRAYSGCFVFFDVDNLKKINDTYGHDAGDRLLKLVGDTLNRHSENSICCRLGGDEFLMFIKEAEKEQAEKLVRGIIDEFDAAAAKDLELNSSTLSAGLVMCSPEDTYLTVYNRADKALYHVKQNGKNDLSFYNEDIEDYRVEQIDVDKLLNGIINSGSYDGAMDVEYRQFTKLYEFVTHLKERFDHPFELVMITLEASRNEASYIEELEKSMYYLEQSIKQTIRNVDIVTRYGRSQILVIFVGTEESGVKPAVDRVFRGYYKMNGSGAFAPTYTIAKRTE